MPNPVIIKYPLDPTGLSTTNLVQGEEHILSSRPTRCIATTYGAYYADSMVITDLSTNLVLSANQWYPGELYEVPTALYGQPVYGLIVITDASVGNTVSLSYQAIGGEFSTSETTLVNLIETLQLDNRPASWPNIILKPSEYPPSQHLHNAGDVYGFEYLVHSVNRIRSSIELGNAIAQDKFYRYVDYKIATGPGATDLLMQIQAHLVDIEEKINIIKIGTGLAASGEYNPLVDSVFLTEATSVEDAVFILDAVVGNVGESLSIETNRALAAEALLVPKSTTINNVSLFNNVILTTTDLNVVNNGLIAIPNGIATLSGGKISSSVVPIVTANNKYKGTWNASTNVPALVSGVGIAEGYYLVSTAGNVVIDGISNWLVNDIILFNGTTWNKISGNNSVVMTVSGKTAEVILNKNDVSLSNIDNTSDVDKPVSISQANSNAVVKTTANAYSDLETARATSIYNANLSTVTTLESLTNLFSVKFNNCVVDNFIPTLNDSSYSTNTGNLILLNSPTTQTVLIPSNSTVAFPIGSTLQFVNMTSKSVEIIPDFDVIINSATSLVGTDAQYAVMSLIKTDVDTWTLSGNLSF